MLSEEIKEKIIIDPEDTWMIDKYIWGADVRENQTYIKRSKYIGKNKYKPIYLHREIMSNPVGMIVDHINGNTLDNRKANLRVCTQAQNTYNSVGRLGTSKYKGVYWDSKRSKWYAEIKKDRKKIYIGLYVDEDDAGKAYDMAAKKHYGEFAKLNFEEEI